MARTAELHDPVPSYRFYVELNGILEGWFTECKGLSIQREVFEYKEGGVNNYTHKLPAQIKLGNVTLKRGLTGSQELWNWYRQGLLDGRVQYANMSILLYDATGAVVRRWDLERAYPVKMVGPDFSADSKASAIETLEIAYHGLNISR